MHLVTRMSVSFRSEKEPICLGAKDWSHGFGSSYSSRWRRCPLTRYVGWSYPFEDHLKATSGRDGSLGGSLALLELLPPLRLQPRLN